jgi:hypothetical protein
MPAFMLLAENNGEAGVICDPIFLPDASLLAMRAAALLRLLIAHPRQKDQ